MEGLFFGQGRPTPANGKATRGGCRASEDGIGPRAVAAVLPEDGNGVF